MLTELHWIVPELLAGSARPGWLNSPQDDWDFIHRSGFSLVVTLTEDPLPEAAEARVLVHHFPICDMCAPASTLATAELCDRVAGLVRRGESVLVHCKAGIGRTGLILACILVVLGMSADNALLHLRKEFPAYVQTTAQEDFVHYFHAFVRHAAAKNTA